MAVVVRLFGDDSFAEHSSQPRAISMVSSRFPSSPTWGVTLQLQVATAAGAGVGAMNVAGPVTCKPTLEALPEPAAHDPSDAV